MQDKSLVRIETRCLIGTVLRGGMEELTIETRVSPSQVPMGRAIDVVPENGRSRPERSDPTEGKTKTDVDESSAAPRRRPGGRLGTVAVRVRRGLSTPRTHRDPVSRMESVTISHPWART